MWFLILFVKDSNPHVLKKDFPEEPVETTKGRNIVFIIIV